MLEHLSNEVHRLLVDMPDKEAAAVFERLRQYQILGRPEISVLFFEAGWRLCLDPERDGPAAAAAARSLLGEALLNHGSLRSNGLAYAARKRIWEDLMEYPDQVVANSARVVLERSE